LQKDGAEVFQSCFPVFFYLRLCMLHQPHHLLMSDILHRFEPCIATTMEAWDIPGLAVAVVAKGHIIYLKGFGIRKLGHPEKVDIHTVFQIASLSKIFTAGLIGILKEKGKIKFASPIYQFLPSLQIDPTITIRHLLSHTGGWPAYTGDFELESGSDVFQLKQRLQDVKLITKPGEVYAYQNVGFSLLGDIVKKVTHLDYAVALKEYLFAPLSMNDASVGFTALKDSPNRAYPHISKDDSFHLGTYMTNYYKVSPAGGINASIRDMAQWLKFCMGHSKKLIQYETLNELYQPLVQTPHETKRTRAYSERIKSSAYGMGFRIYDYANRKMLFHGGYLNGFCASLTFLPDQDIGLVVLTNGNSPAQFILRNQFFDMFLKLPHKDWNAHLKNIVSREKKSKSLKPKLQQRAVSKKIAPHACMPKKNEIN
jgi:beta-lactamase class C